MRASCRKVLEVITTRSGRPARATRETPLAISCRTYRRSSRSSSGPGGSPLRRSWVRREAPSGRDSITSGSSSRPTAISSEPPPMSRTSSRPADQPNQRRTARKVSLASSGPGSTSSLTPVSSRTLASTSSPLAASRTAEVAKASISSAPLSSAIRRACATTWQSRSMPLGTMAPCSSVSWDRCSSTLCEKAGMGWAPACASSNSKWTVFDPTSNTPRRISRYVTRTSHGRARRPHRLAGCLKYRSTSPANGWSSPTPTTPPSSTGPI